MLAKLFAIYCFEPRYDKQATYNVHIQVSAYNTCIVLC